ncbi:MAG: UDP-N-acetylmuramoyl-L-alanyl-D-glutamate--2,6-diaminopimelate ligase [Erysipelotrichaceae bacterium]|nr:UDP-N-acetylmuramoyl-L-alanyl-D-glutamate--2,6-diaminopimelate ligase [Erysipelotrichaceae bacterium]
MKLNELFKDAPAIEIKNLMSDSRHKRPDAIFFCVKGMRFDGHRFVTQAIENGAKVIVHSEEILNKQADIIYIKVRDVLETFNQVADAFYGYPSHKLAMYGVTGTNGKSSISTMIYSILNHFKPAGYIGTISIEYGNVKTPPLLTTPPIDDLHGILGDMMAAGMQACALEVSSIGIEQGRVDAVDFDVAIFTNLTHDHLDYHGTMQNYYEAKKKFFDNLKDTALAITNIDDPYGLSIVEDTKAAVYTYGIDQDCDYQAVNLQLLPNKTVFTLKCEEGDFRIETNLVAKFNIYNLLAVIAALNLSGFSIKELMPYFGSIAQIKGRMERIDEGQPFNVVVDFAHTPDGITKVCQFAAKITPKENRIIAVFGSAGRRDTKKRPIFGEIADKYCDMIILTEDDPRDESVIAIAEEIAQGINDTNYIIVEDRYNAIRMAIEMASNKDTILLLGKGDEDYIYRDFNERRPYMGDDKAARDAIRKYYFGEGDVYE